jgi:hypothetical protein
VSALAAAVAGVAAAIPLPAEPQGSTCWPPSPLSNGRQDETRGRPRGAPWASRFSPFACPSHDPPSRYHRGLELVDALASRWGTLGGLDGRVVWFELDLGASRSRGLHVRCSPASGPAYRHRSAAPGPAHDPGCHRRHHGRAARHRGGPPG